MTIFQKALLLTGGVAFFTSSLLAEENFILRDYLKNKNLVEVGLSLDEPISPCSTFKIPLSLIGYEEGVLIDEDKPVWNFQEGYDDFLLSWKGAITPKAWMHHSCVWYSKVLSLIIGFETLSDFLKIFDYGNCDISGGLPLPGTINPAWIKSSLMISPRQQVAFIEKMLSKNLPISSYAVEMTQSILFKEKIFGDWKLFGKTGYSGSYLDEEGILTEHAWFVGWIEKEEQFFAFSYLIKDSKIDLDQRIPRVKALIYESGLCSK